MAWATAECKCAKCGRIFYKEGSGSNRTKADEWKEWAESHYTLCSECWHKRQSESNAASAAKYDDRLPEISGVSEKQIDYARSRRNKFIAKYPERVDRMLRALDKVDEIKAEAEQAGKTVKEYLDAKYCKGHAPMRSEYVICTTGEARKIIDALNLVRL